MEIRAKLLRVIQDGMVEPVGARKPHQVEVRIIAATNQDLEARVKDGRFREDLFHRLNVIRIHLPPLRARREDIPLLARNFLKQSAEELGVEVRHLLPETSDYLAHLAWPGNVRQLENTCRWITVMAPSQAVRIDDLPPELREGSADTGDADGWRTGLKRLIEQRLAHGESNILEKLNPEFERILLEAALAHTGGRKQEAALKLGWGRNTLTRKLKELGLEDDSRDGGGRASPGAAAEK